MRIPQWLVVASVTLSACQGRPLLTGDGATRAEPAGGAVASARPGRGGDVSLSARDLAPVDAYVDAGAGVGAPNARWILGDEVMIEASREYFGPVISISSRTGAVHRTDEVRPDESLTTLTFTMGKLQTAVENNPRVMIGTGITVSARRVLRVRLLRTTDPAFPVRLRVTATGEASRGHKDKVDERAATLQMGGSLRWTGSAWVWQPIG